MTISDLITAVNIALDRSLPSACQSLDTNDDGSLTVDEIITAVNEALYGCEWPDGHGRSAGGRSTRPNQGLVQVRPGLGAQRR